MQLDRIDAVDAEMQSLIRPEEDRRRLHPDRPWQGGFRWFRSANVICLEHYRRAADELKVAVRKDRTTPKGKWF